MQKCFKLVRSKLFLFRQYKYYVGTILLVYYYSQTSFKKEIFYKKIFVLYIHLLILNRKKYTYVYNQPDEILLPPFSKFYYVWFFSADAENEKDIAQPIFK